MCENGVNIGQLRVSVGQTDDALALAQQWLEQLHHLADHATGARQASAHLAQANVLLGEARGKLETALAEIGGGDVSTGVSVELV